MSIIEPVSIDPPFSITVPPSIIPRVHICTSFSIEAVEGSLKSATYCPYKLHLASKPPGQLYLFRVQPSQAKKGLPLHSGLLQ